MHSHIGLFHTHIPSLSLLQKFILVTYQLLLAIAFALPPFLAVADTPAPIALSTVVRAELHLHTDTHTHGHA